VPRQEVEGVLHALRTLVGRELRCRGDAPAGRVQGFLIDGVAWSLRYARVRLATEPGGPERLLPAAAFPSLGPGAGAISACLTPGELAHGLAAPAGGDAPSRAEEAALHAALHWRPYWCEGEPETALHDAATAIGATLYCGGEPFGHVCDLLVDSEDWSVPALRIAPAGAEDAPLHLPCSFLHDARWAQARFDSDVRAAVLACAPAAGQPLPGRDDLDRLARYLFGASPAS